MKKIYFLAAAFAAMCMVSCSTETLDETVLQSDSNLISFNVNAGKSTKADITTANIAKFSATAIISGSTDTKYFDDIIFSKNGQTFNSANPYYWPQNDALDFFAYAPISVPTGNTLTRTNYKSFVVAPNKGVNADYVDFIYANTDAKTKATSGANGVQINFRHAESKIVVRVKNSAANLQFDVKGWRLGYLSDQGTFVFANTNTDGNNAGTLTKAQWAPSKALATNTYTKTFDVKNISAQTSTPIALDGEMILIPQTNNMATKYTDGATPSTLVENGSYIGLDLKIFNTNDAKTVIFDGSHDGVQNLWAMWPINVNWEPGKKYTYTIDLCGGGYYEVNQTDINQGTDDLDPILGDDAIIKFVDVTVDDWSDTPEQKVNMLLTNPIENAVASFKPLSDGTITYSGDKTKTVTLTATTADFQWPGFPALTGQIDGNDINANNNNVFEDMMSFFNGLYYTGSPVESVTYGDNNYAGKDSNIELVKALALVFNDVFAVKDDGGAITGVRPGTTENITITLNGKFQDATTASVNVGAEDVTLKLVVTDDVFFNAMAGLPAPVEEGVSFAYSKHQISLNNVKAENSISFDPNNKLVQDLRAIFNTLPKDGTISKITFNGYDYTWTPDDIVLDLDPLTYDANWTRTIGENQRSTLQNEIATSFLAPNLQFGPKETAKLVLTIGEKTYDVTLTVNADKMVQFDEEGHIVK